MDATKIIIALSILYFEGAHGFNGLITPRELPLSSSPLRVASTAWATSNDGVGTLVCNNLSTVSYLRTF